jgi:hypothetical protein
MRRQNLACVSVANISPDPATLVYVANEIAAS